MRAPRSTPVIATILLGIVAVTGLGLTLPGGAAARVPTTPNGIERVAHARHVDRTEVDGVIAVLGHAYEFNERSERVRALQRIVGARPDAHYGPRTRARHLAALTRHQMSTSVVPPLPAPRTAATPSDQACWQWTDLARSVGWPEDTLARIAKIMWRESRCFPSVHNPRGRDDSYGLMQLNMRAHRSWVGPLVGWDFNRLFDAETNLRVALRLYEMDGWRPWKATA
jgi:hypothetical protein